MHQSKSTLLLFTSFRFFFLFFVEYAIISSVSQVPKIRVSLTIRVFLNAGIESCVCGCRQEFFDNDAVNIYYSKKCFPIKVFL